MYILQNVNYYNEGLGLKWNSNEWNGEIDMIVLCKNHFIIFELKNKKGIVKGCTKKGLWGIKYKDNDNFKYEKDFYSQCSRIKAYFSQNYWPKNIQSNIDMNSKLRPDVLLVFNNGCDLSKIKFTPMHKIDKNDYKIIINGNIEEYKIFMKSNFHYDDEQKSYLLNYGVNLIDEEILEIIFNTYGIENRVKKWFHVLTEDSLYDLLFSLGSDSFEITDYIFNILIKDFNLIKTNEYFA